MMKTYKFPKQILLLLPLLPACLTYSCLKDGHDEDNGNKVEYIAAIEKAKAIYEDLSPDFSIIQVRSSESSPFRIAFEPIWNDAFVNEHGDSSTTVETNILMSHSLHMLLKESNDAFSESNDPRYQQHLSRAVVLMPEEDGQRPMAFLMTIVGSKHYLEKHDFSLWDVSYLNIPEDFSGLILYHTLSGDFINGWHVAEGNLYKTCTLISDEDANLFANSIDTRAKVECKTITVYKYYYTCRKTGHYDFSTYESRQDSSFICVGSSIKGENYRICSLVDDSYISSENIGVIIPHVDLSRLFASYSSVLYARLQGFMNYMENGDNASRAVISYIDYVNRTSSGVFQKLNVMIDADQTVSMRYHSPSNTVYFKSLEDYSDRTLYEEIIHALQRVVYSDYWEVPFNIEFEAKLIMDYMSFVNGGEGNTEMALNMKYAKAELKNGRSKTLSEWIKANAYSNLDVDDYRQFLSVWKTIPAEYQNYMMSLRSQPKLLPSIINEINSHR